LVTENTCWNINWRSILELASNKISGLFLEKWGLGLEPQCGRAVCYHEAKFVNIGPELKAQNPLVIENTCINIIWRSIIELAFGIISDWFSRSNSTLFDDETLTSTLLLGCVLRKEVVWSSFLRYRVSHLYHLFSRMEFPCRLFMGSRQLPAFRVGPHFPFFPWFPLQVPKYWILLRSKIS